MFHFAGGMVGRSICVLGADVREAASRFFEEFLELTSEQADLLRQAVRDGVPLAATPTRATAIYEEFSRLNNELVNAQRVLHKKNAELKRMADEKNMFAGMAAHDLRNPLGVIMTYAEVLGEELAELKRLTVGRCEVDDGLIEMTQAIGRSSRFMLSLVEQLLDFSKLESGTLELDARQVDLAAFVAENVVLNRVLARTRGLQLQCDAAPDLPAVRLDGNKFNQVLNNLITNALKFSPPEGVVRVCLERAGGDVLLKVDDAGPGVPEDKREAVFQPFTRLKGQKEKSAGLGLAIARRIVRAHGGEIWVEAAPPEHGGGARFCVRIPAVPIPAAPMPGAPMPGDENDAGHAPAPTSAERHVPGLAALPPDVLRGMTVLVADDDPVGRTMVARLAANAGAAVHETEDGDGLLLLLAAHPQAVAVCDLNMPGLGGREAARLLRAGEVAGAFRETPLLALTGDDPAHLDLRDFDAALQKPISRDTLLRALLELGRQAPRRSSPV